MSAEWDPAIANQQVRCIDDPARTGVTTGNVFSTRGLTMVEVRFGPGEVSRKQLDFLEPVIADESALDLARQKNYGSAKDLRRLLTFQKIRGDLTSIFYSMESSNTDFYAHQFKPVLKFIESITGRILIADEVGLGKTIEAMYIWKELRARERATRLLIVCPSMLREKWQQDLENKMGIETRIVRAQELAEDLERFAPKISSQSFAYIASLEALRPPSDYETASNRAPKARLARLFSEFANPDEGNALFDLVVIDEAHYLRNSATANNRLGRLLRDAAKNLVLLTATPIQIGSENLYQLLKLLDPDEFSSLEGFNYNMKANQPYTSALRHLWNNPPDYSAAVLALDSIISASLQQSADPALIRIRDRLSSKTIIDNSDRVEYGRLLESRSFLARYMTRSRKREVLESRVERSPQVVYVEFSPQQLDIYTKVTNYIRAKARGKAGIASFSLIARQRQLASCFPAALRTWKEKDVLVDFLEENLGTEYDPEELAATAVDNEYIGLEEMLSNYNVIDDKKEDQKYLRLREVLLEIYTKQPDEKVVIFAFFRGTLQYLFERLQQDRLPAVMIMGGMGSEKIETIERFKNDPTLRVLLSSEVGSEGIDLQFCHTLVNYDLPWNPMRVEQRIGRLDRLGQKAKRISIINFVITNSIEDTILNRLYERIGLFRDSIGEIEEILGELTNNLIKDLLNPELTDQERIQNAQDGALAVCNERSQINELEKNAVNFAGFSDYLLGEIQDSHLRERWVTTEELRNFVEEFLYYRYPGTKFRSIRNSPDDIYIQLTDTAKYDLKCFLEHEHLLSKTSIDKNRDETYCRFCCKTPGTLPRGAELIDVVHPLVRWIRNTLVHSPQWFHPASAIRIKKESIDYRPGTFAYSIQHWSFKGLRVRQYLAYKAIDMHTGAELSNNDSETLIVAASRYGMAQTITDAIPHSVILQLIQNCANILNDAFVQKLIDYDAENKSVCLQQERTARKMSERKINRLSERITNLTQNNKEQMIPALRGQIKAEELRLGHLVQKITEKAKINPEQNEVAKGFIVIE